MVLPYESEWKTRTNWTNFFSSLSQPFYMFVAKQYLAPLYIQFNHMLISFQKVKILHCHTHRCNWGHLLTNMFPQKIQLGHQKFILPFHDIANFPFYMCVIFTSTPTIDFTQGSFVAHEFWKWRFNSYIFFPTFIIISLLSPGLD
jgi:hypothetical protein